MSLNGWFRPTPEQQAMIRAGWGKRPLREMAAELGVGTAALSIHARDVLGLPRLNVVPKVQGVWTEDEDAILIQGVQDGKTATQLQAMLPHRSFDAVRNRRARWAKRMQFNNVEVAEEAARAKNVRVPMMLVYDESSLMDTSGPTHMDALDIELFSNRRHYGVHPVYNVQRPGALVESFFTQSTEVGIFSQPSEDWIKTLETRLGLKGRLGALLGGPKFKYARWRQGEGLVNS